MKPLKIVILSCDENYYGSSIATSRLAEGLCRAGHEVHRIVGTADDLKHSWSTHAIQHKLSRKGDFALRALREFAPPALSERLLTRRAASRIAGLLQKLQPDIINVHSITTTGWGVPLLNSLPERMPIVWTLHEMWSFTGGCNYSFHHDGYVRSCGTDCLAHQCPGLAAECRPRQVKSAWHSREQFFRTRPDAVAVSPSRWLAKTASNGLWRGHRVETIPNSLDLKTYSPTAASAARSALGLPDRDPTILLTAINLRDRRKGVRLALEALGRVARRPISLLTIGKHPLELSLPGIQQHHFGFVQSERLMSLIYSASDFSIHSALADNLPSTIMESLACASPVVAFDAGGVADMVRPGVTGWLAPAENTEALAGQITTALESIAAGKTLRESCRQVAETEYGLSTQAAAYEALFRELLAHPQA